jgi:hypothetical protein
MRSSILLFAVLSTTLLASSLSTLTAAQPVSSALLAQKMQAACSFLKTLYNPSLGLVRSTPNSSLYYVAGDNLLVENALSSCDPTTSKAINQSIISCCDSGYDRMHEALLGVRIHLPINTATVYTVANSTAGKLFRGVSPAAAGSYAVLYEVHNATGTLPDCTYADTTVYTALELKLEGNTTGARHEMDCLALMYDGRGMIDEAYKAGTITEHGIYQTQKLAVNIYALQKISGSNFYGIEENLFRLQGPDGGFHTGYDQIGTYAGTQENALTTSIALIAISNLSTTNPFPFPFAPFSVSSWIIYFFAAWAVIGVGVVAFVLLFERRKRRKSLEAMH